MKDTQPTIKLTIIVPADLAGRFKPTENKAAVIREALAAFFDKRDQK